MAGHVRFEHRATPSFWECYHSLPELIRRQADENFDLLKSNPEHPSLHFKPVGRFWSARVGISWRALAIRDDETPTLVWFWIGSHASYDRLVNRR